MSFTEREVSVFGGGQIAQKHLKQCIVALNELCEWFGKEWLDSEIVIQRLTAPSLIAAYGSDRIYGGITVVELLVSLWEDLTLLRKLEGYEKLFNKIKKGRRHGNVDLEVSIAAELLRQGAVVELEPIVNGGPKVADCRFRNLDSTNWIYCEITRKTAGDVGALINSRGDELARAASEQDHTQRCVVVVTRAVSDLEHNEILAWLTSKPTSQRYKDLALFFKIPHGADETSLAHRHTIGPVSVRSSGNVHTGAFGVAYLHCPDMGANSKLTDKADQMPRTESGVLFIELASVAGGLSDWQKQIVEFPKLSKQKKFSAFVLMMDVRSADGYKRIAEVIPNEKATHPISSETIAFLSKFSRVRSGGSLMY